MFNHTVSACHHHCHLSVLHRFHHQECRWDTFAALVALLLYCLYLSSLAFRTKLNQHRNANKEAIILECSWTCQNGRSNFDQYYEHESCYICSNSSTALSYANTPLVNAVIVLLSVYKKKLFKGIQYKGTDSSHELCPEEDHSLHCCLGKSKIGLSADNTVT